MKALYKFFFIVVLCSLNLFAHDEEAEEKEPLTKVTNACNDHAYNFTHCRICNRNVLGTSSNGFIEHLLNEHHSRNTRVISFRYVARLNWELTYSYDDEKETEEPRGTYFRVKDAHSSSSYNFVRCEICATNIPGVDSQGFMEHLLNAHRSRNPQIFFYKDFPKDWELKYSYEE